MVEPADVLSVRRARPDDAAAVWTLVARFATSYVPERRHFDAAYHAVLEHPEMLEHRRRDAS